MGHMNHYETKRLSRVVIKGFKSIKICDIALSNINVFIGSNGAGKTNFISAFELLRAFFLNEMDIYVSQRGASSFFYNGLKETNQIYMTIFLNDKPFPFIFGPSDYNSLIPYKIDYHVGNKPQPDYFSVITERYFNVYHFHDTSRTAKIKYEQNISNCKALLYDASNLAAFLYRLRSNYSYSYQKILDSVKLVAPYFKDFELEPNNYNNEHIVLRWLQKGCEDIFNASQLSDGTLRFMCLATLLLQPKELQPAMIIIDEPELGLHPYAIAIFAEMVKKAAVEKQIILSTQSAELLNHFDADDVIVVDRGENGSEFKRLNVGELTEWLEDDYSLGELWNKNILGGRLSK